MSDKLIAWKIEVESKDMDMSGGDNVDGPRWTGGWVDQSRSMVIVAPTSGMAKAAAEGLFYEHEKPKATRATKLYEVDAVVQITLRADA